MTRAVPYGTAAMTLRNTPPVLRLQERYGTHAWRLRDASRWL